jgi:hypothetical protein
MANTMQAVVKAKAKATAVKVVRGQWFDAMFYQRDMAMDFWGWCMAQHNVDVMDCGWNRPYGSTKERLYRISFKVKEDPKTA